MSSALTIQQNTQATLHYHYNSDPLVLSDKERHALKHGRYADGKGYKLVMLTDGDETAAYHLSENIRADNPESLIHRSETEYARLLGYSHFNGSGGLMIGIVDEDNRLTGMGAIEAMDDESSHGSGPVVEHEGETNNHDQVYWKTLGLTHDARGKGHLEELYEARMAATLLTERPFAVLKTNNAKLIENYTGKGWKNLSREEHSGWSLDYEDEKAGRNNKQVDVLVIERKTAQQWYADNKTGLLLPDLSIARYDAKPTFH